MDWNQRPLFRNPHNLTGGGSVGMPIPGYLTGGEAETISFGSPEVVGRSRAEVQQEELGMQGPSGYQDAIKETAELFASSNPEGWDYMENVHWYSENLAYGHQVSKEQVLEDLLKEIDSQRAGMPPKKGFMSKFKDRFKDIIGKENGGIIGLQEAGMVPELFEGQETVEINPELNLMALGGNGGIPSSRAAGGELPEINVPAARNEEGIIGLALDTEEFEDDEPIIALAEQEAKSRLDEEFTVIKSTAQADAVTGNEPAFVIKSGMEDLARAAQRIEVETVEKYPEVPFDANLISSDDLVPYREELVAMFEVPELGQEEFLMAENGGLIPGYQGAGEVLPEEWAWMDAFSFGKELIEAGRKGLIDLKEAERRMLERYGPIIDEIRQKSSRVLRKKAEKKKKYERQDLTLAELEKSIAQEKVDTREKDFFKGLDETDFMIDANPLSTAGPLVTAGYPGQVTNPDVRFLLKKYPDLVKEYEASKGPMPDDTEKIEGPIVGEPIVGEPVAGGIDTALSFAGGASTAPDTGATTGQPSSSVELLKQLMGMRPDISQIQTDIETRKTGLQETLTGKESGISKLEARLEKLVTDPKTGHEKKASDLDEEMNKIFEDMAERIPRQARYASMTAPAYASGSGAQGFIRRMKGKEMKENLFQKLNVIKLEYKDLRKKEVEARRNNDFSLLMNLSMKKQELLADLENTALDADNKIQLAQIDQAFAMELEMFKGILDVELGTGTGTAAVDRAKRDLKKISTAREGLDPEKDADQIEMLEQAKIYNEQIIMGTASDASLIASILSRNVPNVAAEMIVFRFGPEVAAKKIDALGGKKTFYNSDPEKSLFEGRPVDFAEFYNTLKNRTKKEGEKPHTFKKLLDIWAKGKEA